MSLKEIAPEHEVFAHEGEVGIGAVRQVHPDHLLVWFEGHGEERITADQIVRAHDGKVIVDVSTLPPALQDRLPHIHDGETRNP